MAEEEEEGAEGAEDGAHEILPSAAAAPAPAAPGPAALPLPAVVASKREALAAGAPIPAAPPAPLPAGPRPVGIVPPIGLPVHEVGVGRRPAVTAEPAGPGEVEGGAGAGPVAARGAGRPSGQTHGMVRCAVLAPACTVSSSACRLAMLEYA